MSAWWAATLEVPLIDLADAMDALAALGAAGVEWEDGEPVTVPWTDEVFRPKGVFARAYYPDDHQREARRRTLERWAADHGGRLRFERRQEEEWESSWRQYYRPIRPGSRFWVVPAWEQAPAGVAETDILWLDPGMAFGTGTHPSTAMMIVLGERMIAPGQRWLDVGTGSGILALMAWKLGAEVAAVEPDPTAARVAAENFARHKAPIALTIGTIRELLPAPPYDGLLANLTVDLLKSELPAFLPRLRPGSHLLLSGIVQEREAEVWAFAKSAGLYPVDRLADGAWVALAFVWGAVRA